jgi:hypothetical protein
MSAKQTKVRSLVAVAAHQRNSAGAMGKSGKGRVRKDKRSRQAVRASLRGDR